MEDKNWKKNITASSIWLRGLFVLLFFLVGYIVKFLVVVISVFQFVYTICTGNPNSKLLQFSHGLVIYVYQIVNFITFNTETKPFPFSDWAFVEDITPKDKSS